MLKTIGEPCLISVTILVQHICMQVPDRAEYRAKAVQVCVCFLLSQIVHLYTGLLFVNQPISRLYYQRRVTPLYCMLSKTL